MTPVDVANIALAEIGQRVRIGSFTDASPAANAANTFYQPKTQMLLRTANWAFARAQLPLTVWKQAVINGTPSTNPPPQPWLYSYLYPNDGLRVQFLQPTVNMATGTTPPLTTGSGLAPFLYPGIPTAIPFVEGTDLDATNDPIRVILTNCPLAQAIYIRDLSMVPDLWDPLFLSADTALLGSYFINALARDKAQMAEQIQLAKSMIDQARTMNANESISNIDHIPDWVRSRRVTGIPWLWGAGNQGVAGWGGAGWDACQMPDGQFY